MVERNGTFLVPPAMDNIERGSKTMSIDPLLVASSQGSNPQSSCAGDAHPYAEVLLRGPAEAMARPDVCVGKRAVASDEAFRNLCVRESIALQTQPVITECLCYPAPLSLQHVGARFVPSTVSRGTKIKLHRCRPRSIVFLPHSGSQSVATRSWIRITSVCCQLH